MESMSTVGKVFSVLRVGTGAKQVNFYYGCSMSRAEMRKTLILCPTKQTNVLILRRMVMLVSGMKEW